MQKELGATLTESAILLLIAVTVIPVLIALGNSSASKFCVGVNGINAAQTQDQVYHYNQASHDCAQIFEDEPI